MNGKAPISDISTHESATITKPSFEYMTLLFGLKISTIHMPIAVAAANVIIKENAQLSAYTALTISGKSSKTASAHIICPIT